MAKIDMTAPINADVLSIEEQVRTLESNQQAHLQGVERMKLDYQTAAALGDTARMESAQIAADRDAAMAEALGLQVAELTKSKPKRAAAKTVVPKRKQK